MAIKASNHYESPFITIQVNDSLHPHSVATRCTFSITGEPQRPGFAKSVIFLWGFVCFSVGSLKQIQKWEVPEMGAGTPIAGWFISWNIPF